MSQPPQPQTSLRVKLLLAHLLVIGVGVGTLLVATLALAPTLFDRTMNAMMGPGMPQGMMPSLEPSLTQAFQTAMLEALLVSAGVGVLAAVGTSLFVARRILTPLARLLTASQRIAAGHYTERVPAAGDDELATLAAQFNTMAAALEGTEQRRVALIGDVAHELRTPLATIEGYAEGLLDGVVAPTEETWALIHDEAARLRRLVADLQELSRAEAHQLSLRPAPTAPATLAAQAVTRLAGQFAEQEITLTTAVPTALPAVQADPDRILQVIINLLGNTLRYTPAGGTVRLSATRQGAAVLFQVTDSGLGIAPDHLPHLFERFYRVDKARSRALGGSGIGLTIAQAIVEAHGGQMTAASAGLGQGATFSFTVPLAAPPTGQPRT